MLAKKHRLKSNSEIENVFSQGKSTRSDFLFLKYCPNQLVQTRVAFSIGLKFSKKATDRNKAKRLLRSSMGKLINRLRPGYDIVVYLGNVVPSTLEHAELEARLSDALTKASLLRQ